jgi:small subunit ribosomal protein S1
VVRAKVLDVDTEKERISLGIKQLSDDPFESTMKEVKRGAIVTCTVTAITDGGIEVKVGDAMPGFIRKSELSRDRSEQRPDRFAVGEKVDAKVTAIDKSGRKVTLSIKAYEVQEEKRAMQEYGSSDSGASLGDILGAALKSKQQEAEHADSADDDSGEAEAEAEAEDDAAGEAGGEEAAATEEDAESKG